MNEKWDPVDLLLKGKDYVFKMVHKLYQQGIQVEGLSLEDSQLQTWLYCIEQSFNILTQEYPERYLTPRERRRILINLLEIQKDPEILSRTSKEFREWLESIKKAEKRVKERRNTLASMLLDWEPPPTLLHTYWDTYHSIEKVQLSPEAQELKAEIINYAAKKGYTLNPIKDLDKHAQALVSMGSEMVSPFTFAIKRLKLLI